MSEDTIPAPADEKYYHWMREVLHEGQLRWLRIGDPMVDEHDVSDLLFDTPEEAIEAIRSEAWGVGPEDAKDFVLLEVINRKLDNPFSAS